MFGRHKRIAVAVDTNVGTGLFTQGINAVNALRLAGFDVKVLSVYEPRKVGDVVVISTVYHVKGWVEKAKRVYAYVPIEGFIKPDKADEYVKALRNAYSLATVSEYSASMLRNIRSDIYVVPPGIDYNYYAKCASSDREFDVGIVLSASHVGSEELAVRKGSDLYDLVLRGSSYSFIGNKYSMYYLRNWARFAMLVDKPSLVYCSARVLLWLSRSEGFGLPPLEAMASGTPVVYTDAPAHNKHTCCFKVPIKYTWVFDEPDMAYTFLMHEPDVKGIFTALDVAVQNYRDYRDYVMDLAKQYDLKEFSKSLADWLLNAHR
jgi:hypothetical protein